MDHTGWDIAVEVADWLPAKHRQVAVKMIERRKAACDASDRLVTELTYPTVPPSVIADEQKAMAETDAMRRESERIDELLAFSDEYLVGNAEEEDVPPSHPTALSARIYSNQIDIANAAERLDKMTSVVALQDEQIDRLFAENKWSAEHPPGDYRLFAAGVLLVFWFAAGFAGAMAAIRSYGG